ncbi:hypothetical protein [Helicobacter canis]|uniref:Uncharacterized protein n=1 Tax=Helicobacter canis TaxID=29419 RepID=A0A377JLM3_9HELI|nr:hypothetical protein [Helicobacter canis]STP06570.1 Uncharacterised protein [Helicobacter canis]
MKTSNNNAHTRAGGGGVYNLSLNAVNPTDSQKLVKSKATRLSLICFLALSSAVASAMTYQRITLKTL